MSGVPVSPKPSGPRGASGGGRPGPLTFGAPHALGPLARKFGGHLQPSLLFSLDLGQEAGHALLVLDVRLPQALFVPFHHHFRVQQQGLRAGVHFLVREEPVERVEEHESDGE